MEKPFAIPPGKMALRCLPRGDKIIVVGMPVIEYIVGSFKNLARVSWVD